MTAPYVAPADLTKVYGSGPPEEGLVAILRALNAQVGQGLAGVGEAAGQFGRDLAADPRGTVRRTAMDLSGYSDVMGALSGKGTASQNIGAMLTLLPMVGALKEVGPALGIMKSLPDIGGNYLGPLKRITPRLYRETSLEGALPFIDKLHSSDMAHELYFANTPELALGQGSNKGVLLELDAHDIQGQVNRAKPMWEPAYQQGQAELIAKLNKQKQYQDAVRSITIKPDAVMSKGMKRRVMTFVLPELKRQGWLESRLEDGSLKLMRPDSKAAELGPFLGQP